MGSLSQHLLLLAGARLSDSAISQRRADLPFAFFESLLEAALRPRADPKRHAQAFYCGLRLVGIDGTEFSATNCPAIVKALGKAASRRFSAAFAKLSVCLLVELGAHNPLAAAIGEKGEKEYALARRLLDKLPAGCLLLADRLYGVGAFLSELRAHWPEEQGHFLVRVRSNLTPRLVKTLGDGTSLVRLRVRAKKGRATGAAREIVVREIRGRVRRPGCPWTTVRLFTSLIDAVKYPACQLIEVYAQRWEHELAYKELKLELRSTPLLASHTAQTAAQEVAALVLAQSLLAEARLEVAASGGAAVAPLSISFAKLRHELEGLLSVAALAQAAGQPFSIEQLTALWQALVKQLLYKRRKGARRARSCPRAVRKPVTGWPRLVKNRSREGEIQSEVLKVITARASKKASTNQK